MKKQKLAEDPPAREPAEDEVVEAHALPYPVAPIFTTGLREVKEEAAEEPLLRHYKAQLRRLRDFLRSEQVCHIERAHGFYQVVCEEPDAEEVTPAQQQVLVARGDTYGPFLEHPMSHFESAGQACRSDECVEPPLSGSEYCFHHILQDRRQRLFVECSAPDCELPVLPAVGLCSLHQEGPYKRMRVRASKLKV